MEKDKTPEKVGKKRCRYKQRSWGSANEGIHGQDGLKWRGDDMAR